MLDEILRYSVTDGELVDRPKCEEGAKIVVQELWVQLRAGGLRVLTKGGHNGIGEGVNHLENTEL